MLLAVPIDLLIYAFNQPLYESASTVVIEPGSPRLVFGTKEDAAEPTFAPGYLETQVQIFTSDVVLASALADSKVKNLPTVQLFRDAHLELRRLLKVEVVGGSYLIRVALSLSDAAEAAVIVDSVVDAYVRRKSRDREAAYDRELQHLANDLKVLEEQLKQKQGELADLIRERRSALSHPAVDASIASKSTGHAFRPYASPMSDEQFGRLSNELLECDLAYLDAVKELEAMKQVRARNNEQLNRQLDAQVAEAFQKEERTAALLGQIDALENRLRQARASAKPDGLKTLQQELDGLLKRYADMREKRDDSIRLRLLAEDRGPYSDARVHELELAVEKSRTKRAALIDYVETRQGPGALGSAAERMLNHEIGYLIAKIDEVKGNLGQLQRDARREFPRATRLDAASVPRLPTNEHRLRYLTIVPIALFFLILACFTAQEIRLGRQTRLSSSS
jgi:hypothetical protein